jgi:cytochrome o ubiquinol oxidase subunit 2
MANEEGDYNGGAAEINGKGFAGMRFIAKASSREEYNNWVEKVKREGSPLNKRVYEELAVPSENTPVTFYSNIDGDLFNSIVAKYMMHGGGLMEGETHGH